ncbi:S9 family peptidase [Massilia sp. ST3]|uniref:alpha/beta hydrolase family protein n=1 Tax=Massilia sp. ST3 TaxID=2824903 RepID=UPI001B84027B|nr:prolyl oligopeptidase family serine peptidase [Massilia sp. ST3]MBQ5947856.1 S9 family peptidase [Massilia sp. ST3]
MPVLTRALRAASLAALVLCGTPAALAQAPTAPPPVSSFFTSSPFGEVKLSPDARNLAVRASAPGRRDYLAVIDLQTNSAKIVASYSDGDIGGFEWVSSDRLIFDTREKGVGPGDMRFAPGLYAVDRDGSDLVKLAERSMGGRTEGEGKGRKLLPWHTFLLGQRGAQDSDYAYVTSIVLDTSNKVRHVDLLRLNTRTGFAQTVPRPANVRGWILDHKGEPRVASSFEKDTITLHYREPASGEWRTLASYPAYGDGRDALTPLGFGADGTLFVAARTGGDTTALHTLNLGTGKINPEPVLSAKGYDFDGGLVVDRARTLGVYFRTDAVSNEWFDAGMKQVQAAVDKLLPATVNVIDPPAQADAPWVLVQAYSDKVPPNYFVYNKATGMLNPIGTSRPAIQPAQMGGQQFVRYKARDGLEIPALLTLPAGAKAGKLPMVVMVHGGPYVRGSSWGWNPASQFLASRGYAVLEPEFRGSTGFGIKHFKAGFKQWGLAMQDDIADGVRWAVGKGIVDPQRVCIAGGSYGGYATLMGLVNDPDLYKCGIDIVGVTDIGLLFDNGWSFESDLPEEWKVYGMPVMIGDQVKDAAQFKATSPIQQAARIAQPLLLAYGGVDRRVPINHGTQFRDAVMRTNKQVEWIEYPEEGHGWSKPENQVDFWTRVERFLDKHIGKGAAPQ